MTPDDSADSPLPLQADVADDTQADNSAQDNQLQHIQPQGPDPQDPDPEDPDPEDTQAQLDPHDGTAYIDLASTTATGAADADVDSLTDTSEGGNSVILPYPVVAIGASAGGLQAVRAVLDHVSANTGMAFVFIPHLAPDQPSYLVEILSRSTKMPVQNLEDGVQPQPNQVYVLQPGQIAWIEGGIFRTRPRQFDEHIHFSIDVFFRSLAADQKNHAVGVVLSGADSDGTLGLIAISGEGGISIAQSPATAERSEMPASSIAMDHVDFIGSPAEIGSELAQIAVQLTNPQISSLEHDATAATDEQVLHRILQILRDATGLDLRDYKPQTIRRRIARRMIIRRMDSIAEYARFLQLRPDELRILHQDVLINVTRFFRDPDFWHVVSSHLLPVFFQNRSPEKPVRIWCAGCATGEEAYSIAMSVLEYVTANSLDTTVQVFGTDASDFAIEKARTAIYPEAVSRDVAPERLRRFFVKVEHGYQVSKRVRDCCIFARQDLISDPPFSRIDLLLCRNVLIYFNQPLQKQIINTFHYSLEPDGFLLLGMSEGLRDYGDYFRAFHRKTRIYSKLGGNLTRPHGFSHGTTLNLFPASMRTGKYTALTAEEWSDVELQQTSDRMVLARYAPPGLVIDEHMKVLQVRGQTAPYLELSPGVVSWSVSALVRDEIAAELLAAVQRAISTSAPVSATCTSRSHTGELMQVCVDVLPIKIAETRPRCFLVLFTNAQGMQNRFIEQTALPEPVDKESTASVTELRQNLTSTRFHLQTLIEERDVRNQELVSANEEIQSANEELQSTNEELETTKEELQSANEELQTVNDEMLQRNAVLTQTGNDLTNLLNSVNIPLLMLTDELRIRQFTPPMERLLNIRAADIGRSITEIRLQLSIEDIQPILIEVLDELKTREIEVQDRLGKWHMLRIRPYRTAENKIEGLVLVLLDIDQLRSSEHELRHARDFADSVIQGIPIPVAVLESDCTIRAANKAFRELTHRRDRELTGLSLPDLVGHLWGFDGFKDKLNELLKAPPGTLLEFEHKSSTSDARTLWVKGQVLPTDDRPIMLLTFSDITSRREAEQSYSLQQQAMEQEIAVKSRSLLRAQQQLRDLASHLIVVQEEERQRVARELHDDISQRLSLLDLRCAEVEAGDTQHISTIRDTVQALNTDVRGISHRLHPAILKDLGLSRALRAMVHEFREREAMPATYSESNLPDDLSASVTTAIYRITQEALRNITKHAGETHVKVSINADDGVVRLQVRDFGLGFDQESDYPNKGLGMISMEERARIVGGNFSVKSALGEGTTIAVEIPLQHDSPPAQPSTE
jgi:two-component system, chemotaxis family, CheB/CheR fusion protein